MTAAVVLLILLMAGGAFLWYNSRKLTTATSAIDNETGARVAAEKKAAELEAAQREAEKKARDNDLREAAEITTPDSAFDFLRDSFPKDN